MTKTELRERLASGKPLEDVLTFKNGYYKSKKFFVNDNFIVYIPDLTVLDICTYNSLHEEEIDDVIEHCYTGNDFMKISKDHGLLAKDLWDFVTWQNPDLDDFLEGYDKDDFLSDYGFSMDELFNKNKNSTDNSEMEKRIAETAIHITWIYTDLANDGKVFPLMSDEVNSCELMNFISNMAMEFERTVKYDNWMTELDEYATERFMNSEYATKKKYKIRVTETYEKVYEVEAENFDKARTKLKNMFSTSAESIPHEYVQGGELFYTEQEEN